MRSLRARLSLGVGLVIAVVLGVSGVLISNYAERTAREALDDRLRRTAELSRATAVDAVENALPDSDRRLDAVLRATDSSVRLFIDDAVVLEAGRPALVNAPPATGLRTVTSRGERYRVLVTPLTDAGLGDLAKLEVVSSLEEVERRQAELDSRLVSLGIIALLVAVLGAYLAAVRTLGPLRRLRRAAGRIAAQDDLEVRVSETDGPTEVRSLARSFNAMLARLSASAAQRERALEATRQFAFNAGHELRTPLTTVQTTLSTLHRHPDASPEQRAAMLEDALEEQRRLVELLDGLQALARGEASYHEHEDVDLADVVSRAVSQARLRHPETKFNLDLPASAVVVRGWEPGLTLLVANLVSNAAHHGRPGGNVWVALRDRPSPVLIVDDDGEGIPEEDRDRIFEPFQRLEAAADRPGSGLGLALVAQQAREHAATVRVGTAPAGGARVVVSF
ncbi:MAG TPA: HAMP domain-containing sensor histidine kinase [Solirubrobacter sp.]|nr:HAMP domain-containing sensor histidine kinase [Solirubrobacter sp.]